MLNMKKAGWLTLCLLLAFSLVLTACGSNNNSSNGAAESNAPQESSTPSESPEATPAESGSYDVEHAMGKTTIEGTPERIVILTNEGTEALLALGIKPVGTVQSWLGDPWYEHIQDQMADVVNLGEESQPSVEMILSLKPDLIIGNKLRHEKIYDQLNAIAPTVFAETLRGEWMDNFMLYAEATNRKEKGEEVINAFNQRIEAFKAKAGDKLNTKVSIVRFMAGDTRIYHKDSFSGILLSKLGFARPESQDVDDFAAKGVTKEMVTDMDGDVLFYFTYEKGDGEATALEEQWLNDPLFQNLQVYKNGKVHKVSDAIWNTAGGVLAANLMLDDLETYFEIE